MISPPFGTVFTHPAAKLHSGITHPPPGFGVGTGVGLPLPGLPLPGLLGPDPHPPPALILHVAEHKTPA